MERINTVFFPSFEIEVPATFPALVESLGGWVVFPFLVIPVFLACWMRAMRRRQRAFSLALLPGAFLPFVYGIFATFLLLVRGYFQIAANPAARPADLGFIYYRSLFPLCLGAFLSCIAVPLACLAIARAREAAPPAPAAPPSKPPPPASLRIGDAP